MKVVLIIDSVDDGEDVAMHAIQSEHIWGAVTDLRETYKMLLKHESGPDGWGDEFRKGFYAAIEKFNEALEDLDIGHLWTK